MDGETILCISPRRWDSLWRETQQIMSRIAVRNRVIYFEPGRDPDEPILPEFKRNFPNFFRMQIKKVHENIYVIPTPSNLPHTRRLPLPRSVLWATMLMVIKINAWIEIRYIQNALKALRVNTPILWLSSPYKIDFVGKFGEKLVCYHNYDEFANFIPNSPIRELIQRLDIELCRQVDVIFTTSHSQWEYRKSINPNTYCVPNGVDYDLFNQALNPSTSIPRDIGGLKKPIIGFIGWIGYQMDLDLLASVAEAYPDCSLVLVGPDTIQGGAKHQRLKEMPNVHFLGRKEVENLPQYLKAMDVALIPYLLEGYVLTAYPLKLHEYLAAGRAIVSTAMPELRAFNHVIRIAETQAEFISKIREALHDHRIEGIAERVTVARENTWDNRLAEMYGVLDPLLSKDPN